LEKESSDIAQQHRFAEVEKRESELLRGAVHTKEQLEQKISHAAQQHQFTEAAKLQSELDELNDILDTHSSDTNKHQLGKQSSHTAQQHRFAEVEKLKSKLDDLSQKLTGRVCKQVHFENDEPDEENSYKLLSQLTAVSSASFRPAPVASDSSVARTSLERGLVKALGPKPSYRLLGDGPGSDSDDEQESSRFQHQSGQESRLSPTRTDVGERSTRSLNENKPRFGEVDDRSMQIYNIMQARMGMSAFDSESDDDYS